MSYDTRVKGFWKFNNTLNDDVLNDGFASYQPPAYGSFHRNYVDHDETAFALTFGEQSYSTEDNLAAFNFSQGGLYSLWLSFWYYSPGLIEYTTHVRTRRPTSKVCPIIAKAKTNTVAGVETPYTGEFILSEVASGTQENAIQLAILNGSAQITQVVQSSGYLPGWHLITLGIFEPSTNDGSDLVRLEIDGIPEPQVVTPHIGTSTSGFTINGVGYGYTAHQDFQTGAMIKDLVVISDPAEDYQYFGNKLSVQMTRTGVESVVQENFLTKYTLCYGVSYGQPSSIATNQIYVSGSSILLARSDGQLLKGTKPIWDIEHAYNSVQAISEATVMDPAKASWTPQGLLLTGTRVKV